MQRLQTGLVVLLAFFAAASAGLAWRQTRALNRLRDELAAARLGATELESKLRTAAQSAAIQSSASVTRNSAATPVSGPDEVRPPRRPPGGGWARGATFMADMFADPQLAPLLMAQRKRDIDRRYAALIPQLGLSSDQTEKLKSLLAEKQLSSAEAVALARSQGLGRDDTHAMEQQADADSNAALHALLGDAHYNQLLQYEQTLPQRNVVDNLAQRLNYTDSPLRPNQADQLVQILAANSPPSSNDPAGGPGFGGRGGFFGPPLPGMGAILSRDATEADVQSFFQQREQTNANVRQQAAAVLTPDQLTALQQMQQEQTDQARLAVLMRNRARATFGGNGGAGSPPPGPPGG